MRTHRLAGLLVLCAWAMPWAGVSAQPLPREDFKLPIASSTTALEADARFETAAGQAKYLPRFGLAMAPVFYAPQRMGERFSVRMQHRIALRENDKGGVLTAYLSECPVALCPLPAGATLLDGTPHTAVLQYGPADRRSERPFQQLVKTADGLRARLPLEGAMALQEVRRALQDKAARASIVLVYTVRAGVAVEAPEVEALARDMNYQLGRAPRSLDQALAQEDQACNVIRIGERGTANAGEPYLAGRCAQDAEIRARQQRLAALRSRYPAPFFEPADVRATTPLATPDVLSFDAADTAYVFRPMDPPGYLRRIVTHGDTAFSYYQEVWQPDVFRFLPDAFKFARKDELPDFHIHYASQGEPARVRARLDYTATPWANPQRLAAAACELRAYVEDEQDSPDLLPLAAAASTVTEAEDDACATGGREVAFDREFSASCTLTMPELQEVYDRIFSGQPVLRSRVTARLSASASESVPFEPRVADLAGTVLRYSPQRGVLSNTVGHPVLVPGAGLAAWDQGTCRQARLQPAAPGQDVIRMEAGEELKAVLLPAEPPPAGRHVVLDGAPIQVLMDLPSVWQALTQASPTTTRHVEVRAAPWPRSVKAIVVSFLTGPAAVLTESRPSAGVYLYAPGSYRYRVEIVGETASSPGWQQANESTLLVP